MKARSIVVAAAMALATGDSLAFRILESRYHVQVGPDQFIDQLVLQCEDGHTVTIPWQSQLAESCGEDLMGNVTSPGATADEGFVEEQQRQAILAELRSQYGNIPEQQVVFISGPAGPTTRFKPPMAAVLKSYENCRKTRKDKVFCAGERDSATAQLAADATRADVRNTKAAARTPSKGSTPAPSEAHAENPTPLPIESLRISATQTSASQVTGQPAHGSSAEPRAAAEQRIAEEYASCMRAKPKFECEQSRTKAISELDGSKPAKPLRQNKPASAAVGSQAAR